VKAALAACRETGHGQAVHIRGEAGIGKTRLIEEIQRAAEEAGLSCHLALVLDFGGGAGRDAIRAMARSLLGLDLTASSEAAHGAAAAALSSEMVAGDDTVFLNDVLDPPQPLELRPIWEAMDSSARSRGRQRLLARILERTSRQRPRLLVVEDLHWADRPTLADLARLAATVAQHTALLVMTSRIEGDPLDEAWRWRRRALRSRRSISVHCRPRTRGPLPRC
jgi:predicted ATPase